MKFQKQGVCCLLLTKEGKQALCYRLAKTLPPPPPGRGPNLAFFLFIQGSKT